MAKFLYSVGFKYSTLVTKIPALPAMARPGSNKISKSLSPNRSKIAAIVDAAMNDLVRPSLYSAWQAIIPVKLGCTAEEKEWDIVGPVCETGDFLGKQRLLSLQQGDLLAVRSSGAYGFTMSSSYNSRPRLAEIMVDGEAMHVIRERETIEQLMTGEHLLP
jgi:diaminopimelate decarboxylase